MFLAACWLVYRSLEYAAPVEQRCFKPGRKACLSFRATRGKVPMHDSIEVQ